MTAVDESQPWALAPFAGQAQPVPVDISPQPAEPSPSIAALVALAVVAIVGLVCATVAAVAGRAPAGVWVLAGVPVLLASAALARVAVRPAGSG